MAGLIHITISSETGRVNMGDLISADRKNPREFAIKLRALCDQLLGGNLNARVTAMADDDASPATAAAFTIACTRANATTNYVAIAAKTSSFSVTTANTSRTLTAVGDVVNPKIGDVITGTGIPLATTIVAIDQAAKTILMSAAATDDATVTATVYERANVFLEGTDFVRGEDDTATGANLAAAINTNITNGGNLKGLFASVASVTGTITLTALMKSIGGRQITIATDDATAFAITNTVSGATGNVRNGARAYEFGVSP